MVRRIQSVAKAGVAVAILAALVGLGAAGAAPTQSKHTLVVSVTGEGSVVLRPSGRVCRRRCSVSFAPGTTVRLTARPAHRSELVRWAGACSGHAACAVRLTRPLSVTARFGAVVLRSWNPAYTCKPLLTTIPFILGSKENALHGASEEGGGLQPHLRGQNDQHLLDPPCSVGGTGTFVEIHDIVVTEEPERSEDGDETANMFDPNRSGIANLNMKTIGTEIDNQLIGHRVAPETQPPKGMHVDIQGFVFWDPAHTTEDWHAFSGWEIHSLTAWRPATK